MPPIPPARPRRPRTLGVIALSLAAVAAALAPAAVVVGGYILGGIGAYVDLTAMGTAGERLDPETLPAAARALVEQSSVWLAIGNGGWMLSAIAALVLGVIAIATRRGRAWGVAAVILAPISYIVVQLAFPLGLAWGTAPYV
jgi:hypothetical protein